MLCHWYITRIVKVMVAPILLAGKIQHQFWMNMSDMLSKKPY